MSLGSSGTPSGGNQFGNTNMFGNSGMPTSLPPGAAPQGATTGAPSAQAGTGWSGGQNWNSNFNPGFNQNQGISDMINALSNSPQNWMNTQSSGTPQTYNWTTPAWAGSPGGTTKALSGPFGSVPAQSWDPTAPIPSQSFSAQVGSNWPAQSSLQASQFNSGVPTPSVPQYAAPNYQLPTSGLGAAGQQISSNPAWSNYATMLGRITPNAVNHLMRQSFNPLPGASSFAASTPGAPPALPPIPGVDTTSGTPGGFF